MILVCKPISTGTQNGKHTCEQWLSYVLVRKELVNQIVMHVKVVYLRQLPNLTFTPQLAHQKLPCQRSDEHARVYLKG